MRRSLCSQSYIRAKTLGQNEIEWEGGTVALHWKSMAIRGDEDQRVQKTCFNVVDEELASQAGLRVDILVGRDHGLPLSEQIRTLAAEATSSAGSSISGRTDDFAAQSSDRLHSGNTGRRSQPVPPRGLQPQIVMLMFNGPDADLNCVSVYSSLRHGPFIGPAEDGRSDGRSVESQGPGSARRESSHTTSPGNRSRSRDDQAAPGGRKRWRRWTFRTLS